MRIFLIAATAWAIASQGVSGQMVPPPPPARLKVGEADRPKAEAPRLVPGTRVRIWTGSRQYTGVLAALSDDSLWLRSEEPAALARSEVQRVDVSVGKKGHTLAGLGIGFGVGMLGAAVAASSVNEEPSFGPSGTAMGVGLGTWAGITVIGGVVGTLLKSDRWAQLTDWTPAPKPEPPPVARADPAGARPSSLDEGAQSYSLEP